MKKAQILNKGDVIRTQPQEGFWDIAVVLSQREKTPELHPMCHIAITPLLFHHKVSFEEISIIDLKPLIFEKFIIYRVMTFFQRKKFALVYIHAGTNQIST